MLRGALVVGIAITLAGCGVETGGPSEPRVPVQQVRLAGGSGMAISPDSAAMRVFTDVMAYAREERLHQLPTGAVMQAVAYRFLGSPYVAGMLDEPQTETLIAGLTGFDCVLLVETALAMARGIAVEDYSYDTFMRHIEDQRYRGGTMKGYCSRLHYFTEWIADNEARGTVDDITARLGGEELDKRLTFMSEHRDAYPRFATNDSLFQGIKAMERDLATRPIYYIPQDRVRTVYDRLEAGDIVAMATSIGGLDVTHSGLVYKSKDGSVGFLHASTSGGVKVSPDLQSYVENNRSQIGIVVARSRDARPTDG